MIEDHHAPENHTPAPPDGASATAARRAISRLDWGSSILLIVLTVAETAAVWLVARLVVVGGGGRHGIAPIALFVLVAGAALTPHLLSAYDVWHPRFEVVMSIAMAGTTLAAVKAAAFPGAAWLSPDWLRQALRALILRPSEARVWIWSVVLVAAFAWWRGRHRAPPTLDAAYTLLRVGLPVVLAAVLVNLVVWGEAADRPVSGAVLVFFAAALAAIALAHLGFDRRQSRDGLGPRWLAALALPIGLVLGLALIGAGIFSQDLLSTLVWALAPLFWALLVVFRVFILLVAVVAFLIVSPILWLLAGHQLRFVRIPPDTRLAEHLTVLQHAADRAANAPDTIRYLIALAILSGLFSAAARFIFRRRRKPGPHGDEERESLVDFGDLFATLPARLRRLLRPHGHRAPDPLAALRRDPRWAATVTIREAYRQFLRWSCDRDLPRATATTPDEHAAHLSPYLPTLTARGAVAHLTEHYDRARYAADPAPAADAAAARAAFDQLIRATREGSG